MTYSKTPHFDDGKTTAEKVAEMLDNDGSNFVTKDGKLIDDLALEHHASKEWGNPINQDWPKYTRFVFPDGSAIVANWLGWDIEGDEPFTWRGPAEDWVKRAKKGYKRRAGLS